ncbi:50S ribosomal protein L16 [Candidatus Gracilibacteria bacterium]|nr:50S ribosomal protein L16 [Candidatus Gracilibacteria bacterium]MCF7856620.1 50S ribosomal protein L16 [Candidatus Gracilibacteria bacterium]MCF7896920.1 50S ribosomal protein L16 [Candidatus Gracilibacteria bacterium]
MLFPKKTKYRKWHRNRGSLKGVAVRGSRVAFGSFGMKILERAELTSRQIEAGRRAIQRYLKRGGKLWIRVFPHKPITQKAAEVPMGSGKGSVDHYVAAIKPGTVVYELEGVSAEQAKEAFGLAGHKFPVKTKFVTKDHE